MVMSNGRYLYQTDRFANERFLYSKARLYADGSIIIDDKCDGVIYTRIGNEYFKWDYEGVINMQ
jgi:hypothetical protein